MATDVSVSEVWGTNAGFYAGNAIPSAITTSSNLFLIIPVSEAFEKANSGASPLLKTPFVESNFDSASDALGICVAPPAAYTAATTTNGQKTTGNLRQFATNYIGKTWSKSFESGKEHYYWRFDSYLFEENQNTVDLYGGTINTIA